MTSCLTSGWIEPFSRITRSPDPYASEAFSLYLRPTLATIAAHGPLEFDFLGKRQVPTAFPAPGPDPDPTFFLRASATRC